MKIPAIKLSEASQSSVKKILKRTSEGNINLGEQTIMAGYYAFLNSAKVASKDYLNYAKMSLYK